MLRKAGLEVTQEFQHEQLRGGATSSNLIATVDGVVSLYLDTGIAEPDATGKAMEAAMPPASPVAFDETCRNARLVFADPLHPSMGIDKVFTLQVSIRDPRGLAKSDAAFFNPDVVKPFEAECEHAGGLDSPRCVEELADKGRLVCDAFQRLPLAECTTGG